MARSSGPEEFFEAFREVQQGKKALEGAPARPTAPAPAEPGGPPPGTLCFSYLAGGLGLVIVLLLVAVGYFVGRWHGWSAYEAMLKHQAEKAIDKAAEKTATIAAAQPRAGVAPEVVDGMVFTLLTLGKGTADRDSAQKEADYLNKYEPFKALGVEAYVWRDGAGRYRLCARGLKDLDDAARKKVRDQIRKLSSRHGKHEYRGSDFLPK